MIATPWPERPSEEARLLNPAFVGVVLAACAREYQKSAGQGLPYPLAFVAVPIVLHRVTREALPRDVRTSMASWLLDNTQAHVGYAERVRALVPFVKEAILFASNGEQLALVDTSLEARGSETAVKRLASESTTEVRACIERSGFVGRWLAGSGDGATIMALWGIAP